MCWEIQEILQVGKILGEVEQFGEGQEGSDRSEERLDKIWEVAGSVAAADGIS